MDDILLDALDFLQPVHRAVAVRAIGITPPGLALPDVSSIACNSHRSSPDTLRVLALHLEACRSDHPWLAAQAAECAAGCLCTWQTGLKIATARGHISTLDALRPIWLFSWGVVLRKAYSMGHTDIVEWALTLGADLSSGSAFLGMCEGGHVDLIRKYATAMRDPHLLQKGFLVACKKGQLSVVDLYLDMFPYSVCIYEGIRAAATRNQDNVASRLIQFDADPDSVELMYTAACQTTSPPFAVFMLGRVREYWEGGLRTAYSMRGFTPTVDAVLAALVARGEFADLRAARDFLRTADG